MKYQPKHEDKQIWNTPKNNSARYVIIIGPSILKIKFVMKMLVHILAILIIP